jgi:hypothetical protein
MLHEHTHINFGNIKALSEECEGIESYHLYKSNAPTCIRACIHTLVNTHTQNTHIHKTHTQTHTHTYTHMQVLSLVFKVVEACLAHLQQLSSVVCDDILRAAKVPAAASNQVARDMRAVLQVVAGESGGPVGVCSCACQRCMCV